MLIEIEADILHMKMDDNTYRTYRDLTRKPATSPQMHGSISRITAFFSYGITFPVVGRLLCHSFMVVCCALGRFRRKGDYTALYDLLIDCLTRGYFRHERSYRWWYLMRFAVAVLQERQINWLVRDVILEDNLILVGSLGPRPMEWTRSLLNGH